MGQIQSHGSATMQNGLRILSFAAIAAALVIFAALGSRAKSPRNNAEFPRPAVDQPAATAKGKETAVLSGGCFWGVQAVYEHTKGVISATSGYSGGEADTASYEIVGSGKTEHAESVKIVYDPSQITYGQLLMIFFSVAHNPTELNKQGPDWGTQYRSSIFYASPEQEKIADAYIRQMNEAKVYSTKIMTVVVPLKGFYPAEGYHQDYLKHHPNDPYIVINDAPKIQNLKREFPQLYRDY
jgi:peptide-methionine (S)-S-oxide reductase